MQICLAAITFENTFKNLPPGTHNDSNNMGWGSYVLPYLERPSSG
jgi:hypothetical protein